MNDLKLSENAKNAMHKGLYDDAISYARKMENKDFSLKFELLIIEHEHSNFKKAT